MHQLIAPIVLGLCLAAIFLRGRLKDLAPWKAMATGGAAVILLGAISPAEAFAAIDWGVMAFLYGMFVLAAGLEESGYLWHLAAKVFKAAKTPFGVLVAFVFGAATASALLLNDTVAIIGTPLAIGLARKSKASAAPLLVGLALAVTIGSVASPIGNPQNYLIASRPELTAPFVTFAKHLLVPTVLSLLVLCALLWKSYPQLSRLRPLERAVENRDGKYRAARTALILVTALSLLRLSASFLLFVPAFPLYLIAIAGAAAYAALCGEKAEKTLKRVDWETLAFFAGMFVLMDAVWLSGEFQRFIPATGLEDAGVVVVSSLLLSQVVSNVPFVALYLKALGAGAATKTLALLAAGSTLAGGLTLFGAASNIIVLQNAEKRGEKLPVAEFAKIGVAATLASAALVVAWNALL